GGAPDADYKYIGAGPRALSEIGVSGDGSPSYKLTYDLDGSLISKNLGQAYTYNFDGKLATYHDTSASPDPASAITYDGTGTRTRKSWLPSCGTASEVRYYGPFYEERWSGGALQYRDRFVTLGSSRI